MAKPFDILANAFSVFQALLIAWAGISERLWRFDYGDKIHNVHILREIQMVQILANTVVNKINGQAQPDPDVVKALGLH